MADSAAGGVRHFLDIDCLERDELERILAASTAAKTARQGWPRGTADSDAPLSGRLLAMIFEKPSTRTRVSFDAAMRQLGGETLILAAADTQLGRGESVADTARVLSRYVDAIMLRTHGEDKLRELARHAAVPVINGLTDQSHPCQVMADLMTLREHKGRLRDQTVAWSGDSNNVTSSWLHAAGRFGFALRIASPEQRRPDGELVEWARRQGAQVSITGDPDEAVSGATCVVTDTWVSMNDDDTVSRHNLLQPYQVNARLMRKAAPDAIFMHCLPAHRGEEVTDEVMDGPRSVVFDEAENRLHVQKGILAWCLGGLDKKQ